MSMTAGSTPPAERVQELIAEYADPQACVATLLCDRHPASGTAYTIVERDLTRRVLTYGELREASERFASVLASLGVMPGDRVATLMGKTVEHLIAIVGIWRLGAVHVPLFTALPKPRLAHRVKATRSNDA